MPRGLDDCCGKWLQFVGVAKIVFDFVDYTFAVCVSTFWREGVCYRF